MDSEHEHEKQHAFFQYPHFAVVGASDDDKKWGGLVSAVPRKTVKFRLTSTYRSSTCSRSEQKMSFQ